MENEQTPKWEGKKNKIVSKKKKEEKNYFISFCMRKKSIKHFFSFVELYILARCSRCVVVSIFVSRCAIFGCRSMFCEFTSQLCTITGLKCTNRKSCVHCYCYRCCRRRRRCRHCWCAVVLMLLLSIFVYIFMFMFILHSWLNIHHSIVTNGQKIIHRDARTLDGLSRCSRSVASKHAFCHIYFSRIIFGTLTMPYQTVP